MKCFCSKKGDLPDMLVFMLTIFILGIGLFIFAFVIPEIAGGLNLAGMNESAEGKSAIDNVVEMGVTGMQRGFFLIFVGLIMGIMITSFLVRTHPIFIFMYILFLGLTVFLSTYIGNAFEQVVSTAALEGTVASQGFITIVMQNLLLITLVVGALSMIIIFAKFSSVGGQRQPL